MNPQAQTRKKENGDCIRACVATLLEVPILQVPDFTAMREDGGNYPTWYLELQAWLKKRGLAWVEIPLIASLKFPELPFPVKCIFMGTHPNGGKHAIVGEIEDRIFRPLYDPLEPTGDGPIVSFRDGGLEAVALLVPLDPYFAQSTPPEVPQIIQPTNGHDRRRSRKNQSRN